MESYKVTAADVEAATGDVYQPTVEAVRTSRSWSWTILGALGFLCLCAVASFCFVWHSMNKHQAETFMELKGTTSTDPSGQQKMLTEIAKSTKAAIHLHASGQAVGQMSRSPRWVSGVDQSFTKGGLTLENNSILIPHDGLYFVYSQASFKIKCHSDDEENAKSNIHLSYSVRWSSLTSPSKEKHFLLNGVKSMCQATENQQNGRFVYDSIYLGAVFQLYKGDKLSTDTNHLTNIEDQTSKTFFGVFEL
ncbi:tumor necrosis factor b (TNF superfamily, member 2) [Clarias gariepinus]